MKKSNSIGNGPLNGLNVLEFSGLGPAPFCAMMLADLGATITRIDRPDASKDVLDPILGRGRRSIQLDLKNPNHQRVAHKLIKASDVLLEGYRPNVMERLGLCPIKSHELNPKLIYVRLTGWGQHGPSAHKAGHDINYIGAAGVLNSIGIDKPVVPLNLVGDYAGGASMACIGLLAALRARDAGERNIVIDAAMSAGARYLLSYQYELLASGQWKDERHANLLDGAAPFYDTYRCADGKYVAVGAIEDKFFEALIQTLALQDELEGIDRLDHRNFPRLRSLLSERFATLPRDAWMDRFKETDACVSPVLSMTEIIEQSKAQPAAVRQRVPGVWEPYPAPHISVPSDPARPAPSPGQHTAEILGELGLPRDLLAGCA